MSDLFRQLPSVDSLLGAPALAGWPATVRVAAARQVLDELRQAIRDGSIAGLPDVGAAVAARAQVLGAGRLRPVINATGVVLHTNLGRAQWGKAAREAAVAAMGACNLEVDLESNERGGRLDAIRWLLQALVGAEDALVVNNCAASVLLALTALARDREVVVSRGELVEIGGSFRVPDVIASGGARLVGVGTTNRTRVADFVGATGPDTAAWLRVHPSNFRVEGFTEAPDSAALRAAAVEAGVVLMEDLGSGCLTPIAGERTVQQALADAELVMFSGDKLLGGPQAGIVVGSRARIQVLRKHPLYRALRVDKVTLAALEATLATHLAGDEVLAVAQLHQPASVLQARAEALRARVGGEVVAADGLAGGGTLPNHPFPGFGVLLAGWTERDAASLRTGVPAVAARVAPEGVLLDVRCVPDHQVPELAECVVRVAQER